MKFYSLTGQKMLKVVEEHGKLEQVLSSKMISHQVLKKYLQMHKMEKLYCHFFKTNTNQNDEIIQKGRVGLTPEKRDPHYEQNLFHVRTRTAPHQRPIQAQELDFIPRHDFLPQLRVQSPLRVSQVQTHAKGNAQLRLPKMQKLEKCV